MRLSNKQQFGIGLGTVALITFFTSMSVKLFNSIKNKTIKHNCEKYPLNDVEQDEINEQQDNSEI